MKKKKVLMLIGTAAAIGGVILYLRGKKIPDVSNPFANDVQNGPVAPVTQAVPVSEPVVTAKPVFIQPASPPPITSTYNEPISYNQKTLVIGDSSIRLRYLSGLGNLLL